MAFGRDLAELLVTRARPLYDRYGRPAWPPSPPAACAPSWESTPTAGCTEPAGQVPSKFSQ